MNNTEINRQIVQDGLDRRAEEAKQRDAELEDQARKLRLIINANHTAKTAVKTISTPPETPHSKPNETEVSDNKAIEERRERRAEEAREARECFTWYRLMIHTFAPLLIAIAALSASIYGAFPIWLMVPISLAGCTLSITTFTIWCIYHRHEFCDLGKFLIAEFKKNF